MGIKANQLLRDDWRTPPALIERLLAGFFPGRRIGLDVAASPENAVCPFYLTSEVDALRFDWQALADAWGVPADDVIWCNPPYSRKQDWIRHALDMRHINAYSQSLIGAPPSPYIGKQNEYGLPVRPTWRPIVLLLPASTSESWMDDLSSPGVTNLLLAPRVPFYLPDIRMSGNMGGSMISIVDGLPSPDQTSLAGYPKVQWGRWRWKPRK